MQSYLLSAVDDDSIGADFGAFKSVYTGIGSLGTTYVGVVTDVANYEVAFWGFVPSRCSASCWWSTTCGLDLFTMPEKEVYRYYQSTQSRSANRSRRSMSSIRAISVSVSFRSVA